MKIYPEMDKEIIKLLDMEGMPLSVYAARCIEKLQAENAELRARLKKAVELPCELGSPLYVIDETRDTDTWELKPCVINKYYAAEVTVCENGDFLFQVETSTSHKRLRFGEDIFTTRAEAEAHLKELQEEEERR